MSLLYGEYGSWFHLLSDPADYAEEAEVLVPLITEARATPVGSMLELGSGGGNLALHLKEHYPLTLTDLSPQMLELSKTINPELEHLVGDMRELRLGRRFDAVLIHDAIGYMKSADELGAALTTAFEHLGPGGLVVAMPDCTEETFEAGTEHGGHDGDDGRGLRYLEWSWDPDPSDQRYQVEYACILREADGSTRAVHDTHTFGLFSQEHWLAALEGAGFEAATMILDRWNRPIFRALRP